MATPEVLQRRGDFNPFFQLKKQRWRDDMREGLVRPFKGPRAHREGGLACNVYVKPRACSR